MKGPFVTGSGKVTTERVTESLLFNALAAGDLDPVTRAMLPGAIASLADGDAAPLLHIAALAGSAGEDDGDINAARLLATTCIEGRMPWSPDSPVASRAAALKAYAGGLGPAPFAPFRPATVLESSAASLCAAWPATPAPQGVASQGPDVPVLVLSGREDLRTPTEDARRTAAQYPHAQVLTIPEAGHSVLTTEPTGCALDGMVAFLAGRPLQQCSQRRDGKALAKLGIASPYLPASISGLKPTRVGGLPGRTLTAVALTVAGVVGDIVVTSARTMRVPGLRAGYARVSRHAVTLAGVEWFRGVRVSGTLSGPAKGTLTVSGPNAAAGTITLSGRTAAGTLGGRAIR
ncbi:alpha/beta hydrolase [Candidatus Solirubrobacter pratensis]|uniref:alpha/beta hydrolase n=1 Tax=Candidatus Solirubrobacter pratensis TaxID=1298857 RepID=UPI0012DCC120|nr:alpha/beta hydrolase [Candidatus Solirubrobacter pratensis]